MSRRSAWTRHLRKAKPVTFDGYAFATANEAGQYRSLRDREERGEVRALQFTSEPTRLRVRYQVRDRDGSYLDAADAFTLAAPRKPAKYRNVKTGSGSTRSARPRATNASSCLSAPTRSTRSNCRCAFP
jgi:hypothetical protein